MLAWVGSDPQRAALVASIVDPFEGALHPVLRALIRQFGPQSSAAKEIAARMRSSQGVVSSMVQDDSERLAYARAWTSDEDAEVRLFASNLVIDMLYSWIDPRVLAFLRDRLVDR